MANQLQMIEKEIRKKKNRKEKKTLTVLVTNGSVQFINNLGGVDKRSVSSSDKVGARPV